MVPEISPAKVKAGIKNKRGRMMLLIFIGNGF
jgi:hypothetical protein